MRPSPSKGAQSQTNKLDLNDKQEITWRWTPAHPSTPDRHTAAGNRTLRHGCCGVQIPGRHITPQLGGHAESWPSLWQRPAGTRLVATRRTPGLPLGMWLLPALPLLVLQQPWALVVLGSLGRSWLEKVRLCLARLVASLWSKHEVEVLSGLQNSSSRQSSLWRSGFFIYFTNTCSVAVSPSLGSTWVFFSWLLLRLK